MNGLAEGANNESLLDENVCSLDWMRDNISETGSELTDCGRFESGILVENLVRI